jgi:L-cysteine desulfidase
MDLDKRMELLKGISFDDVEKAKSMVKVGLVTVREAETEKKLYIEVIVATSFDTSRVVIEDAHTNVTLVEVNGERQALDSYYQLGGVDMDRSYPELTLSSIMEFVEQVDIDDLGLVQESIRLNQALALEGLEKEYGLKVGKSMVEGLRGMSAVDDATYAMALTAAASDARMGGSTLAAMSNSGSGNQGISATLPIFAMAERMGIDRERMIRAITLSHLITIHIKSQMGRLSALCGVTVASTGASAGIAYLLGGGPEEIYGSIQNMMGNVVGMICDGAKAGCALKVATSTNAAIQSSALALKGIVIQPTDGIIDQDPEETINNMCRIGNYGTLETDKIILDIMLSKANC